MAQLIKIPLCETSNAPKFDRKTSFELPWYLEDIEDLGNAAGLDPAHKIKEALHYAVLDEVELWQTLVEAVANLADWNAFVAVVNKLYSRCEDTNIYCHANIQHLVQDYRAKQMKSWDDLGVYTQAFQKISALLIANWKLAEVERDMLYLNGFPSAIQQKISNCQTGSSSRWPLLDGQCHYGH